jgi:hypothetical protein
MPLSSTPREAVHALLDTEPAFMSLERVASITDLSVRSVSEYCRKGVLASTKPGRSTGTAGRRLVLRSSLEEFLAAGMDHS